MALYRVKAQAVFVKIESVSGTPEILAGTDVVRTKGVPELEFGFLESGERNDVVTGILSAADDAAPAGNFGRIELTLEIKGAGAAYSLTVAPEADALLRMCGLARTVTTTSSAESILYTTIDSGGETGTVGVNSGGKLFTMAGCVASLRSAVTVNGVGTMTFTVIGKMQPSSPTETAVGSLVFAQVKPPPFNSATNSIGGWTSTDVTDPVMLLGASFDLGNVMADLPSAGATDGLVGYTVSDRSASQELTLFVPPLSKANFFAFARAAQQLITIYQIGATQYNRLKVSARWIPKAPRGGDRSGMKIYTLSGPLRANASVNPLTSGREIELLFN